jgi:hypothetical protein
MMGQSDDSPHGFYADPVDEDGNVIAHAEMRLWASWCGEIPMVKVPSSEMVLPPDVPTFKIGDD